MLENLNISVAPPQWKLIELPKIRDERGNLTFIENHKHIPFDIQRTYYLYDVPAGEKRGSHAHKQLAQLMIAIAGSFDVTLSNGVQTEKFQLNKPFSALYIPPRTWRDLDNFSSGGVCLVLASMPYSENDYIRSYEDFIHHVKTHAAN